jgi:hypothetical protein
MRTSHLKDVKRSSAAAANASQSNTALSAPAVPAGQQMAAVQTVSSFTHSPSVKPFQLSSRNPKMNLGKDDDESDGEKENVTGRKAKKRTKNKDAESDRKKKKAKKDVRDEEQEHDDVQKDVDETPDELPQPTRSKKKKAARKGNDTGGDKSPRKKKEDKSPRKKKEDRSPRKKIVVPDRAKPTLARPPAKRPPVKVIDDDSSGRDTDSGKQDDRHKKRKEKRKQIVSSKRKRDSKYEQEDGTVLDADTGAPARETKRAKKQAPSPNDDIKFLAGKKNEWEALKGKKELADIILSTSASYIFNPSSAPYTLNAKNVPTVFAPIVDKDAAQYHRSARHRTYVKKANALKASKAALTKEINKLEPPPKKGKAGKKAAPAPVKTPLSSEDAKKLLALKRKRRKILTLQKLLSSQVVKKENVMRGKTGSGREAHVGTYPNIFTYALNDAAPDRDNKAPKKTPPTTPGDGLLYDSSLQYRLQLVTDAAKKAGKLTYLNAQVYNDYPLLMVHIKLDQILLAKTGKKVKITSGPAKAFTRFVMSFYTGLINALALNHGLKINMTERSSFGFATPSIAETGNSFRLNLGITPPQYAALHAMALKQLDAVLVDMLKPENSELLSRDPEENDIPDLLDYYSQKAKASGDESDDDNEELSKQSAKTPEERVKAVEDTTNWLEFAFLRIESTGKTAINNVMRTRPAHDYINTTAFNAVINRGKPKNLTNTFTGALKTSLGGLAVKNKKTMGTTIPESAYATAKDVENDAPESPLDKSFAQLLALYQKRINAFADQKYVDQELKEHLQARVAMLRPDNPELSYSLDAVNELLFAYVLSSLKRKDKAPDLNDGYGSESEVEEEAPKTSNGPKRISGKKIITHNGMRAILTATESAVNLLQADSKKKDSGMVQVDVSAAYYEVEDGLKHYRMNAKKWDGKSGAPHIIIRDVNACVTDGDNPYKSKTVTAQLTGSPAQVWIIDTTSATQGQSHAILNAFRKSKASVLCLVASGFKNEQGGADKNPYGTVRTFSSDPKKVNAILKHIKENDLPLAAMAHIYRRMMKELGFVPTNQGILNPGAGVKPGKGEPDDSSDSSSSEEEEFEPKSQSKDRDKGKDKASSEEEDEDEPFHRILELIRNVPRQKDNPWRATERQPEQHDYRNQHASVDAPTKKEEKKDEKKAPAPAPKKLAKQFTILDRVKNRGDGDCLFYSLEEKSNGTMSLRELVLLRQQVSQVKMRRNPNAIAHSVSNALSQTPGIGRRKTDKLLTDKHIIPESIYQQIQATPGIYAGDEELTQWCKLRNKTVAVIGHDNSLGIFTAAGRRVIDTTAHTSSELVEEIRACNKILYQTYNHYERVNNYSVKSVRPK